MSAMQQSSVRRASEIPPLTEYFTNVPLVYLEITNSGAIIGPTPITGPKLDVTGLELDVIGLSNVDAKVDVELEAEVEATVEAGTENCREPNPKLRLVVEYTLLLLSDRSTPPTPTPRPPSSPTSYGVKPWVLTKAGYTGASNTSPDPDREHDTDMDPGNGPETEAGADMGPDTERECMASAAILGVNGDRAQNGEGEADWTTP